MTAYFRTHAPMARVRRAAAALAAAASLAACGSILDVNNPNNVVEESLNDPASVAPEVSGVLASLTRAMGAILTPYSVATDELTWVGSREGWNQLDRGSIGDAFNEFVDQAFPFVAEARWLSAETVKRLEEFEKGGKLVGADLRTNFARAYLYAAAAHLMVGDAFDDFAFSSRREAAPNIGRARITVFHDSAIVYLDKGLAVATQLNNAVLRGQILALRARAKFDKAVRQKLATRGTTPASPLVNDAGASADAQAAIAAGFAGAGDRFRVTLSDAVTTGALVIGGEVNRRQEMRLGEAYIVPSTNGKTVRTPIDTNSISLRDPVTNLKDPVILASVIEFTNAVQNTPITIVSGREMYLILAEAALAQNNITEFQTRINALRAFNGLAPWTPASPVTALNLLKHERRVNLFLQLRRLADLYRFGERADRWSTTDVTADAVRCTGTFFPITVTELQSNTLVKPPAPGCSS